ncbi:MAG: signal peptidase II [Elusimicrobiota bacterium]
MRALRAAIVVGALAVDRATKLWAIRDLQWRLPIRILPFFSLVYAQNTGASFGLGAGANWLFVIVSSSLIAVLLYFLARWPKNDIWLQAGGALILGGALGNLYDRLAYRYVVDFLDVRRFAICNAADCCITVGAVMLAWGLRDAPAKPAA